MYTADWVVVGSIRLSLKYGFTKFGFNNLKPQGLSHRRLRQFTLGNLLHEFQTGEAFHRILKSLMVFRVKAHLLTGKRTEWEMESDTGRKLV